METVRGRSAWAWVILWLSVTGLIGAMAWSFFSYGGLQDRLAELPRTAVPGEVDIEISEPDTLTVYYEDPTANNTFVVQSSGANTLTSAPVELTVTGPSGDLVETAPYERDLRFDYDGRVLIAIATIEATDAGTYTVAAEGDVADSARVSVGHIVVFGLVANVIGVVGLFLASVFGVAVAVIWIRVRRGRPASPEASPERTERPKVGV